MRSKPLIILSAIVLTGVGATIALRPGSPSAVADTPTALPAPQEPRGVQYFRQHIEEARKANALCDQGDARGQECANAEAAIAEFDGKARFKRFMGH
jgi:hypothetical protein